MMPSIRERARYYNRNDAEDYIQWLSERTGIVFQDDLLLRTSREDIDIVVEDILCVSDTEEAEKPSWVEAAQDVVEMIVPDLLTPFTEQDYNSMTVRELQEECRKRDLTIRGTKAEVVLRLNRDDEGIVEQETEDETEAPSEEAAEAELDAPSEELEAVTEDVTDNDNSGKTEHTDEEE